MANKGTEEYLHVGSFKVTIEGMKWENFDSISRVGLDIEDLSYQADKNQILNRPGRFNARDITLTRHFKKDKELYSWVKDIKAGKQIRKSGSIILLDDESKEVARFNFFGAWPKSWSGPALSKDQNGNAILSEEITLSIQDVEMA